MFRFLTAAVFLAGCLISPAFAEEEVGDENNRLFHPGRILIQPREGVLHPAMEALQTEARTRVLRSFPGLNNIQVLELPPGANVRETVRRFQRSGLVEMAEPDYIVQLQAVPNDPSFLNGTQWALRNTGQSGGVAGADISAPDAWDTLHSAPNVVVGVIDSGIRYTHEDLAGNMWVHPQTGSHGWNAVARNSNPMDDNGHGTHVAGIIGAVGNNGRGIAGVAWNVRLMALKFSDSSGSGAISAAIECIDFARTNGVHVINASWGMGIHSSMLQSAIRRARDAGILFVAAAGNSGGNNDSTPFYPASYSLDNIVAVAATTRTDSLAGFSNYGANSVHLGAPGASIYSTYNNSNASYSFLSGTSMAAPHVAGALALMRARYPNDDHRQLIEKLLASTDPLPSLAGRTVSGGRLNLLHALGPTLIAAFTVSATSGDVPFTVQFTDASEGEITSWEWNFGDGSPVSNHRNPVHTFESEGEFTVTLTIRGNDGASRSVSQVLRAAANYSMSETVFDWINPSGMPVVSLGAGGVSQAINLPFVFNFYGQNRAQAYIAGHGLIGFQLSGMTLRANTALPNPATPNAIIAPYWDDLILDGGSVRIGVVGSPPNRRLVISWFGVRHNSLPPTTRLTFQVILEETSNRIVFQYQEVSANRPSGAGGTATVGLENTAGTFARQYSHNVKSLANGRAIQFSPTAMGGMTVAPTGDFASSGQVGGPFSPESQTYTVENNGSEPMEWAAWKSRSWVTLSSSGGTLAAGQTATVVVSISSQAAALSSGRHIDAVSFVNLTSGAGNTTREVSLDVTGVSGRLEVSPEAGFVANGPAGGPFTPDSYIYTLINSGDATIEWLATSGQPWVAINPSNGSLGAGETAAVAVSIRAQAEALPEGAHSDSILFNNLTNGEGSTSRSVTLNVSGSSATLEITPAGSWSAGGFAGGPFQPDSRIYTLVNSGAGSLSWSADASGDWLEILPSGGELPPGESIEVVVSLGEDAAALPAGNHDGSIAFKNLSAGNHETIRTVELAVYRVADLSIVSQEGGNGGFTIRISAEPGLRYLVEASGDFLGWLPIHEAEVPPDGILEFSDSESELSQRFYRAAWMGEE